jgi:hypothetical protein
MLLYALSFWAGCFLLVGDDYAVLPKIKGEKKNG